MNFGDYLQGSIELIAVAAAMGFGAVGLRGEEQTRAHRPAIEHDRARAAHAMLATDMGADQAEIVAQKIHQRAARLHGSGMFRPVDDRGDRDFFRHSG